MKNLVKPRLQRCGSGRGEAKITVQLLSALIRVTFSLFVIVFIIIHFIVICLFSSPRKSSHAGRVKNVQRKVSIIIPAYNEEDVIGGLIHRLGESSYPIHEIIVVDDGSIDSTYEVARNMNVIALRNEKRLGKPTALNIGVREAKGDVIIVFDADTMPTGDCVGHLVEPFQIENVGAVAGCTKVLSNGLISKLVALEFNLCFYVIEPFSDRFNFFPIIHGANFAVRRELAHFSEDALTEDFDLTINLATKGYRIKFEPEAVNHVSAPPSFSVLVRQRKKWVKGILGAYKHHFGFWNKAYLHFGCLRLFLKVLQYVIPLVWASSFSLFLISLFLNDFLLLLTALSSITTCSLAMVCANFRSKDKATNLLFIPFLAYFYNLFIVWFFLTSLVRETLGVKSNKMRHSARTFYICKIKL